MNELYFCLKEIVINGENKGTGMVHGTMEHLSIKYIYPDIILNFSERFMLWELMSRKCRIHFYEIRKAVKYKKVSKSS